MTNRRSFVPEAPTSAGLEGRVAPSVGGWLNHTFKQIGDRLTPHHHVGTNAAAGIEQMWKDSAKADKAAHAHALSGSAHQPLKIA